MLIMDILERNARQFGTEVSLVEINPQLQEHWEKSWEEYALVESIPTEKYRRELTWSQFDETANQLANLLMARGIGRGNKVALLLMNCLEWLPIYFGILKTGAVAVPMNYRYTGAEIKYCLELSEGDLLIFGPEFTERVRSIREGLSSHMKMLFVGDECPEFAESYEDLIPSQSKEAPKVQLTEEDDAAIYFSSGTTGFPKAILHAHASLTASCLTENANHGQTKEDSFLCIPPLYHTGAKMHWFGSFLVGGKGVLLRGVSPKWILRAISQEQLTIVWLLVPWVQDILDAIDSGDVNLSEYKLDQWRMMHVGAQPVPPSLIKRWKEHFPDHLYDTNYGLTESIGPGCVHLGLENLHKVGAIGKAGHGWETRIVDEKGCTVPPGTVGELAVRGVGVMKCYYRDPEATAQVLRDGWLFTGDMAMMDEDGFLFLVDRKKDVIISGGENLYPVQIEDYIRTNEAVKDVAVIGLPDRRLGEIAAAIIELKPGKAVSRLEMEDFFKGLPRYKRPREIIFDQVPRNPTGKIEKPKLRQKYR